MSLDAFLNPKKVSTIKFTVSDRFIDANGDAQLWEARPLSGEELSAIQNECLKPGTKSTGTTLDTKLYQSKIIAASVVFPPADSAELLTAYKAQRPEELFGKMLTGAEYQALFAKISQLNGLDKDISELVTEAKN